MDPRRIMMLVEDYNATPDKYSDKEAEMIAGLAQQSGQEFRRESKPLRKLAFNLADTASFGLLPDSIFKPESRGETVYGQTAIDSIASGVGALGGLATGIGGLYKGGVSASKYLSKPVMGTTNVTRGQQMVGQARDYASKSPLLHSMRAYGQRGAGAIKGTAAAQGVGKGFNKLVKNMSEKLLISEDVARKVLMGSVGVGVASQLPIFEEGTPNNPFSSYYNYPKLYGNAPAEERYFSDPNRDKTIPGAMY